MAAVTPSVKTTPAVNGWKYVIYSGTGAADTIAALTTTAVAKHKVQKLIYASCTYSDTPTQAGVTTTVDDSLGASFDSLMNTGSANATYTLYAPTVEIPLAPGDAIVVTAPAAGGVITAALKVVVAEKDD